MVLMVLANSGNDIIDSVSASARCPIANHLCVGYPRSDSVDNTIACDMCFKVQYIQDFLAIGG